MTCYSWRHSFIINNFETIAIAVSFAAGVCIVISRTLNAKLAVLICVRTARSIIIWLGFSYRILFFAVVPISNIIIVKISTLYLTLLIFIDQVFSGVLIDMIISQALSLLNLSGGVLVATGMCVNLLLDRKTFAK